MAKGRKKGHQRKQRRVKNEFKEKSKGKKRSLKECAGSHSNDTDREDGILVKKPKKDFSLTKNNESDSSDGEQDVGNPFLELVKSLGAGPGSYGDELKGKWRDDESDKNEEEEIEEELGQSESEDEINETKKQVNGDAEAVGKLQENSEGNNDREVDDDEENGIDDTESMADDYRTEGAASEESEDEEERDESNDADEMKGKSSAGSQDPFTVHFEQDLSETTEKLLSDLRTWERKTRKIPSFGNLTEVIPSAEGLPTLHTKVEKEMTFADMKIKSRLAHSWQPINKIPNSEGLFTPLQQDLFYHINAYKDVYFSSHTFQNGDEIRRLYCLHAVNHILKRYLFLSIFSGVLRIKTRSRVMKNTAKIVQSWKDKKEIGELRDQGLTRPKILILVPFRDAALKVVEVIMHLICPEEGGQVMNKKRFYEEFGESEDTSSSKENRPEDFKQMFAGNIDDCFRIGISVLKKCVKLYAKFYSSDIIVASPLGLRTIIGSAREKSHEYDFLSSIEVIIADQTDVFLMQNWEHVQHVFEHLHQQPKDSHDVDFSRVRMWCLNGWSKYYRQTLIFSSFVSPEMNSLFNRQCFNFSGKVKVCSTDVPGSICQVAVQVPQAFHRFDCSTFSEAADKRFQIFINKVLPDFKGSLMGHTAIFVPSYFDFVRLRNYFKREGIDCAQISEYSQPKEIQRARTYFQQGKRPFLLFTERFYFFYRYRIRGIKNIIFYELPHYSMFYTEILNFMDTRSNQSKSQMNPVTCTVLYTKSNALRLARVVGSRRCGHMISTDSQVHMLVTGDEDE